jgi:hypothetical protein
MKAFVLALAAVSMMVSAPALAGKGGKGGSDARTPDASFCGEGYPVAEFDMKGRGFGYPWYAYLDYEAAGGTLSWGKFEHWYMANCGY